MEPETVVVPVEGDLHAYATLEEEEESPLRAPGDATLDVGTRVQIVVYDSATDAYVNDFEYEVTNTSGAIEPVGVTSGLTLTTGNYKFVAYSFNTTTVPGYAASITDGAPYSPNANASDPLWGISGPHSITAGGTYNISIAMKHQFSRVAIKATTDGMDAPVPTISAMEAVLLGYKADEMTALTGALTKGAAEDQTITFPTFSASTTVTSDACMVYAGGESTTSIKITSATIGGTTGSIPLSVRFNQKLDPGKSYTLRISFKNLVWAKSNIYWVKTGSDADGDIGYLTFDTTDEGHQGYQGVLFKWGSLVGVSPALTAGADPFSTATPVYIPTYNISTPTASTWKSPTTSPYSLNQEASTTDTDNAASIPYVDGRDAFISTDNSTNDNFLVHPDRNTAAMYTAKRGDICQYLSKTGKVSGNYRLPITNEFGLVNGNWNTSTPQSGWLKGSASWPSAPNTTIGNAAGTVDLIAAGCGYGKNVLMGGNTLFPAVGMRQQVEMYKRNVTKKNQPKERN
jgi:hypothetical protein